MNHMALKPQVKTYIDRFQFDCVLSPTNGIDSCGCCSHQKYIQSKHIRQYLTLLATPSLYHVHPHSSSKSTDDRYDKLGIDKSNFMFCTNTCCYIAGETSVSKEVCSSFILLVTSTSNHY